MGSARLVMNSTGSDRADRTRRQTRGALLRASAVGVATLAAALALAVAPGVSQSDDGSTHLAGGPPEAAAHDPLRRFNRGSFRVNAVLDRFLLRPVARTYRKIVPAPMRRGLGNAVNNLREPSTVVNAVLQGRPKVAARATARFVANSTVGLLGLFDVAKSGGLERQPADFGQTLGRYGVGQGAYIYLPIVGPTTVRDGFGSVVGLLADPVSQATGGPATDFATGRSIMRGLNARSENDATLTTIMEDSTDPYATIRSGYLQNRDAFVREATGEDEVLPDFDAAESAPEVDATQPVATPPVATPP